MSVIRNVQTDELENLYYGYDDTLRRIACRVAPGKPHLWDDMVQEGWLRLAELKTAPKTNPDAFYRQVAKFAMLDFLRKERDSKNGAVQSFARAKRFKLLRCSSCGGNDLAWTVHWPNSVRCRDCKELVVLEELNGEITVEDVKHQFTLRKKARR